MAFLLAKVAGKSLSIWANPSRRWRLALGLVRLRIKGMQSARINIGQRDLGELGSNVEAPEELKTTDPQ